MIVKRRNYFINKRNNTSTNLKFSTYESPYGAIISRLSSLSACNCSTEGTAEGTLLAMCWECEGPAIEGGGEGTLPARECDCEAAEADCDGEEREFPSELRLWPPRRNCQP